MQTRKFTSGFTMIELMVTLIIIAILAGIAIPTLGDQYDRRRVTGAADAIYAHVQQARGESIDRGQDIFIDFVTGTNWCMGITDKASCDCSTANDCTIGAITYVVSAGDYSGTTLATTFAGNDTTIQFPRATANKAGTASVSSGGLTAGAVVSPIGRARFCSSFDGNYPAC